MKYGYNQIGQSLKWLNLQNYSKTANIYQNLKFE